MQLGYLQQSLRRSTGRPAPLFPLFQSTFRYAEQPGELLLRQAGLQARPHDGRGGFGRNPLTAASLDFLHSIEHFLLDVTSGFGFGERAPIEFLSHFGKPPSTF